MMKVLRFDHPHVSRLTEKGFTLTEMLATLLILTLASTLLATGVPVAIDTYQKTVKSSNAQLALSTTITLLRSEIGMSTDVRIFPATGAKDALIVYMSKEGYWSSIGNAPTGGEYHGLIKRSYKGQPLSNDAILPSLQGLDEVEEAMYPLISNSAITSPLAVRFDAIAIATNELQITNLRACEVRYEITDDGKELNPEGEINTLASVGDGSAGYYPILIRY